MEKIECKFKPRQHDDPKSADPVQSEFFTEGDLAKSLINEGTQNSLDSKVSGAEKVKIRIFLSGEKYAIQPKRYLPLINSVKVHLESPSSGLMDLPDFNAPMKFMVFEDFNTTGLEGDPELPGLDLTKMNPLELYNFFFYWRNTGRSGKMEMDLGRWGLGKTAFSASSRINTNFGLTVRNSDGRKLLMGETTLRTHFDGNLGNVQWGYNPYGMWGNYSSDSYFCRPIESEEYIKNFEKLTHMSRENNSGLSNFLPFVRDKINAHNLLYFAIEQYFLPIIKGELEYEIQEEDMVFRLNKSTIIEIIEKLNYKLVEFDDESFVAKEKGVLKKNCEMATWSLTVPEEGFLKLSPLSFNLKPRWSSEMFSDEKRLDLVKDVYEKGGRIAIKVPMKYQPKNSPPETRWFNVFMEKDLDLKSPEQVFIRGNLTISGVKSNINGNVRAMAIIQDPKISKLLGDAENPSHNSWSPNSRNFQSKYIDGENCISFVQNSFSRILGRLHKNPDGLQKDLLIDFFSISKEKVKEATSKGNPKRNNPGGNGTDEEGLPDIPSKLKSMSCHQFFNGIRLKKKKNISSVPESVLLELAYDVISGNPINFYEESDFDVSRTPIEIESKGIRIIEKVGNKIRFEVENNDDFELTVIGFDKKRDLFYKITENQTENKEEQ